MRAEGIWLKFGAAVHLGLISNELIYNAVKSGFEGIDRPRIDVAFGKSEATGMLYLEVADNGPDPRARVQRCPPPRALYLPRAFSASSRLETTRLRAASKALTSRASMPL